MKYTHTILLSILFITSNIQSSTTGGIALGTGACIVGLTSETVADYGIPKIAAHITNTDAHDLVSALAVSCGLLGARECVDIPLHKDILFNLAISSPLATIICTHSAWNKLIDLPLVGHLFACDNTQCKGICSKCKLKVAYRQALGTILIAAGINKAWN